MNEQQHWINQIVDSPTDLSLRAVYADWLDESGDVDRAKFVRELSSAIESLGPNTQLPAIEGDVAWTNMLGLPLLQGVIKQQAGRCQEILTLARPSVTITTKRLRSGKDKTEIGSSKFLGEPDLPSDVPWPRCEYGPLAFLAQIDMSEISTSQVCRYLPSFGILSFFGFSDAEEGIEPGFGIDDDVKIFWFPNADGLVRTPAPSDVNELAETCSPAALEFVETWDLPSVGDAVSPHMVSAMAAFEKDDDDWEILHDMRVGLNGCGNHLGGYSCHFRTDDLDPGAEWNHILCLDSDRNTPWSWCDGEHLALYVHEEDLANKTFNRIIASAS